MKLAPLIFALLAASANSAPLPSCDFSGLTGVQKFLNSPQLEIQSTNIQKLKNISVSAAATLPISKGDGVLVTDLEIIQKDTTVTPTQPFRYSANILAISFSYSPTKPQAALYCFKANNGESYHVLMYDRDATFIKEDGRLCDRVMRYSNETASVVLYMYQTDPEDVKFEFSSSEKSRGSVGLRIIFGGTSAGVIRFDEDWTQGGRVIATKSHSFDQFAPEVKVAGFVIQIVKAAADAATVNIVAPEQRNLAFEEARVVMRYLR